MMNKQLDHDDVSFDQKKSNVVLVCDGIASPANVGAIFRLADAFGVEHIYFCDAVIDLTSNRLKRTARNTVERVLFTSKDIDTATITKELINKRYQIIALEISEKSINIKELKFNKNLPIALLIGNERHGVSKKALKLADQTVHIPMSGTNSSMNVAQATAIALFALT